MKSLRIIVDQPVFVRALLLALGLAGCVSNSPRPAQGILFVEPRTPSSGHAIVYIFRPGFTEYRSGEAPQVYIDGQLAFPLQWKGYEEIELVPGEHLIEVKAVASASSDWNMSFKIVPIQDQRYFLAIWNSATASQWSTVAAAGKFFIPMYGTAYADRGTRYELVKEQDALPVLRECRRIK